MSDLIETWKNDFREFVNSLNLSRDDYKAMMEYIDEIPAVQPDHIADSGKMGCVDVIRRQAAIDAVNDLSNPSSLVDVKRILVDLSAEEPEIIRCKDCKWYELPSHRISENCVRWMKRNCILLPIKPNDYCSYAERREDETD